MNIISRLNPFIKYSFTALLFIVLSSAYALKSEVTSLSSTNDELFLPVEQAYMANVFSDNSEIVIDWLMADSYYLYEHAFAITANGEPLNFSYSRNGQTRADEYFGDVTVFYNNLQLVTTSDAKNITVTSQGCADAGLCYPPRRQHFYYDASTDSWLEGEQITPKPSPKEPATSLIKLILFAFIGGLILNLMPCVLPVLTIKALSFAKQEDRLSRIKQGWAYTAGVVLSFALIAGLLIILKTSGQAIGWGFQLQSPVVIAALVYIFFMMALSLSDVFHFNGIVLSDTNDNNSLANSFSTGVLACVVASPCTAPFMGTAIATALTLSTLPSLLIFVSLGLGMAAPFLLLSYIPKIGQILPKPGPWMNTLKQFLAFPLFGTCIWLISIANAQGGTTAVSALLSGCTLLAMIAWWRKSLGALSLVAILIIVTAVTAQFKSSPSDPTDAFSLSELDQRIKQEQAIFVNVTATWCITCKANEVVLNSDTARELFSTSNTAYVVADWTAPNSDISKLLERHKRNGIPLYLLYRNGNMASPTILPQFLSLATLEKALKK